MSGLVKAWSATSDSLSGDITIGFPGVTNFTNEAHYLVSLIAYRSNAPFVTPSGWTKLGEANTGNTDDSVPTAISSLVAFGKRQVASPPASFTFTRTGGDIARGRIFACDGIDFSSPLDVIALTTLAVAATAVVATGVTTTQVEALLLSFLAGARAGDGGSSPAIGGTPLTALVDGLSTSNGAGLSHDLSYVIKTSAGATGNFTWTHALSARHAVAAIALKSSLSVAVAPDINTFKFATLNPTVRLGSIVIEPNVVVKLKTVDPTLVFSSTAAAPAPSTVRLQTVDPVTSSSSVTVAPTQSAVRLQTVNPTVKAELVVPVSEIVVRLQTADPSVVIGEGPKFNSQAPLSSSWENAASVSDAWTSQSELSNTWTPETSL